MAEMRAEFMGMTVDQMEQAEEEKRNEVVANIFYQATETLEEDDNGQGNG